jgi:hypothetical protein
MQLSAIAFMPVITCMKYLEAPQLKLPTFRYSKCSFVATDLGNCAVSLLGMKSAPVTVEDGAAGIVKVVDQSTKATPRKIFTYEGIEAA